MAGFSNQEGSQLVYEMIRVIRLNKQYLSDIDGATGDGDHGINMNKGFVLCEKELEQKPGNLSFSLETLSRVLVTDIGGSMGPLYGMMFGAMSEACASEDFINENIFSAMMIEAEKAVREIGSAEVGDKTLLDTLVPAVKAFNDALAAGSGFIAALKEMKKAAEAGMNSTRDMVARVGRASRLGQRSKGFIDAGAASCCFLITAIADSAAVLIK